MRLHFLCFHITEDIKNFFQISIYYTKPKLSKSEQNCSHKCRKLFQNSKYKATETLVNLIFMKLRERLVRQILKGAVGVT